MEQLDKKFTAAEINDMSSQLVKVTLLLDNSTSMNNPEGFKNGLVNGVNNFFEYLISTNCVFEYDIVTFNTSIQYLHRNKLSKDFSQIDKEYTASGCTAFYDSVGKVIKNQRNLDKEKVDKEKVDIKIINILLVVTDGLDNSSTIMSSDSLKTLIEDVEKNNNFKVILLGTEIDTGGLAHNIGLCKQTSASFEKTEQGINNIMSEVSYSVGRCITSEIDVKDLKINNSST